MSVTDTDRSKGAVGPNAVIPKFIDYMVCKDMRHIPILDFGAGKEAIHTKWLREEGFTNVTAWDIGENFVEGVHNPNALNNREYWLIFASNVLNIIESKKELITVIRQLERLDSAVVVLNYPKSPRRLDISFEELGDMLRLAFKEVKIVPEIWQVVNIHSVRSGTPMYMCFGGE